MKTKAGWIVVAALVAAAVSAFVMERGAAQYSPPGSLPYQTGCAAIDANTVEGYVTNPTTGLVRIDGLVTFTFTMANSMSRPAVQVPGSALIPPGRTMSVARAKLLWSLQSGEVCQLDVTGAVK